MPMNRTEKFHDEAAKKGEAFKEFEARMIELAVANDWGIVSFAGEDAGKGKATCQMREVIEEWVTGD